MPTAQVTHRDSSTAAIFARLWESRDGMSPAIAKHVLKLEFSAEDARRMHELAAKNQTARLSAEEAEELESYVKVGDLLAILQSKARKLLKKIPARAERHG